MKDANQRDGSRKHEGINKILCEGRLALVLKLKSPESRHVFDPPPHIFKTSFEKSLFRSKSLFGLKSF